MLDRSLSKIIKWFCLSLLLCVFVWTCSGCYTEDIAAKQVNRAQAEYGAMVAGRCAVWYPPKESTVTETKYLPGIPIPGKTNYVTVDCDSAISSKGGGAKTSNTLKGDTSKDNTFDIPCPPCDSVRIDTFEHKSTITVENTARIIELQGQVDNLKVYEVIMWCLSGLLLIVFTILLISLKKMKNGNK